MKNTIYLFLVVFTACFVLTGCIFAVDYEMPGDGTPEADAGTDTDADTTNQNGGDRQLSIEGPGEVIVEADGSGQFAFSVEYVIDCQADGCTDNLWCAVSETTAEASDFVPCDDVFVVTEDDVGEGLHSAFVELRDDDDERRADDEATTTVLFDFTLSLSDFDAGAQALDYSYPRTTDVDCSRDDCLVSCRWEDTAGVELDDEPPSCDEQSLYVELPQEHDEAVLVVSACADLDLDGDQKHCTDDHSYHFVYVEPHWDKLDTGGAHSCAIIDDGSLWCWGSDSYGQRGAAEGDGTTPEHIALSDGWLDVATGSNHSCAVDGDLYCWGANAAGQSEPTAPGAVATASAIDDDHTWQSVTAGKDHSCAITDGGQLYCWGDNSYGQLGSSDDSDPLRHVAVPDDYDDWMEVSAGNEHTCAIADNSDGESQGFCWGRHELGRLGIGNTDADAGAPQPLDHSSDYTFVTISAGAEHSCASVEDDPDDDGLALLCWGHGANGRLGFFHDSSQWDPQEVISDTGAGPLSAGTAHTCLVDINDRARCWGKQDGGRLGDGLLDSGNVEAVLTNAFTNSLSAISAGDEHSCVISKAGDLYCWGQNDAGQLGTGDDEVYAEAEPITWPHRR